MDDQSFEYLLNNCARLTNVISDAQLLLCLNLFLDYSYSL